MYFEGDGFETHELNAAEGFLQKSSGAFVSQQSFNSNDPYRDFGDATRGIGMGQFGWPDQMSKPSNDFYAVDDDVVRGCSIGHAPGHDSFFSKPTDDGMTGGFFSDFMPPALGHSLKEDADPYSNTHCPSFALQGSTCPLKERFQQDDVPPAPPKPEYFRFEPTIEYITTSNPHHVANSILDFLESRLVASIEKVRREKYSIKVHIFQEHIMCTTKIRIWRVESQQNRYAIEFQRRDGDPFVFGDGYRRCIDFLDSQFPNITGASMTEPGTEKQRAMLVPQPPPFPTEVGDRSDEELDVELFSLLDLASMEQCPNLQAEAASSLAKRACEEICIARYLSKAENLDKLLPLLSSDSLPVVYPTARMLSSLATNATTSVAEHRISKLVIEKIGNPCSNQLVRLELAKAVSAAFQNPPYTITPAQAQDLKCLLESTMRDLPDAPALELVRCTLEDVLLGLSPYCYPAC